MSELKRLVGISNDFNRAVAFKYASDMESRERLQKSFTQDDIFEISTLQNKLQRTAVEVFKQGGSEEEAEEQMAPAWLEMTEVFVKVALRVGTEEDLAELLPDEARNEATAQSFAGHGAIRMANLCRK
jgi:hypothetical protein